MLVYHDYKLCELYCGESILEDAGNVDIHAHYVSINITANHFTELQWIEVFVYKLYLYNHTFVDIFNILYQILLW